MSRIDKDINPVQHITVDAIGAPGRRVFYLQGWGETDPRPLTVIIEKIHLQNLVQGIGQVLDEITRQQPERGFPLDGYDAEKMHILPPVDPLFRVGDLGIGYHAESDRLVVFAREMLLEGQSEEDGSMLRFWCTRKQVRQLAAWGQEVIQSGRKICPQCGEAMEADGHFCPKKNGRKKH